MIGSRSMEAKAALNNIIHVGCSIYITFPGYQLRREVSEASSRYQSFSRTSCWEKMCQFFFVFLCCLKKAEKKTKGGIGVKRQFRREEIAEKDFS